MSPTDLPDISCGDEVPRLNLLEGAQYPDVHAIDYLEVRPNQRDLHVHFVSKGSTAGTNSLKLMIDQLVQSSSVSILGGERVRHIHVIKLRRLGERLIVTVNQPGDFSTYTLALRHAKLDPAYTQVPFSFKVWCPSRFDCRGGCLCDEPDPPAPPVDYMAKDYDSFRQALIDRLPAIAPEWLERHEADLGIALIELLAYAGDQLSYQQDAVANEAYLPTARQRISVRRHARLLDYTISEGASARAFVAATVSAECAIPAGTQLITRRSLPLSGVAPFGGMAPPLPAALGPLDDDQLEQARSQADAVFETLADADLHPRLNAIEIYTWDLGECCLPVGTTTVDLRGDIAYEPHRGNRTQPWRLRAGSFLILEETAGVVTGLPGDADPTHRQVVRLTAVTHLRDPLIQGSPKSVTRVEWAPGDALAFPLCINTKLAGNLQTIAVARGNVLVADHGEQRDQWWPMERVPPPHVPPDPTLPAPGGLTRGRRPVQFLLDEGPPSVWRGLSDGPVATMNDATAKLSVSADIVSETGEVTSYAPADDLIGARAFDQLFVPEVTNDGRMSIRFGDGANGRAPADGSFVHAYYRVGRGRQGNVGAETLAHILIEPTGSSLPVTLLRNPLPASGGVEPETTSQVKVSAPYAFRSPQLRAVTEADYAEVAMRYPGVSGAVARFRWTGSWLTVYLILDATDRSAFDAGLAEEVKAFVQGYTQTGYDLEARPAEYVPLDIELFVCVAGDRFRADLESDLLTALSSRRLPGGKSGFFGPGRFGFGQPLYLSALYAAAQAVPGVVSVKATRFSRYYDDDPPPTRPATAANIDAGLIPAGELEVLELMNDPSLPERGVLMIATGGGR